MKQFIAQFSLVVKDYDEAIAFYVGKLGFSLVEDHYIPEQDKRWVVVAPTGGHGCKLLLARASDAKQQARIGDQTGGRVGFFLYTDDFWRDYEDYRERGVEFTAPPREEPYGTVVVFRDLYGNLWDLLQPALYPASKWVKSMPEYHLAHLNIAAMKYPMESTGMADFTANLERINRLADNAPGFVWRLQSEEGNATEIRLFGENTLVNLSVWHDLETLRSYVYDTAHASIMRRRREWFDRMEGAHLVLWWVPASHLPGLEEARSRLDLLRDLGPSQDAFHFSRPFNPPG